MTLKKPLTPLHTNFIQANCLVNFSIGGKTLEWINVFLFVCLFLCFRQQRVIVNGVKLTGPLLCLVSQRAPFSVHCCSPCSLMTNPLSLTLKSGFLRMTVCYRKIKSFKTVEDTLKLQKDLLGSCPKIWA